MWIRLHPLLEAVYECRCDWGVIVQRLVLRGPIFTIYRGNFGYPHSGKLPFTVAYCLLPVVCWRPKSCWERVFDSWLGFIYFRILGKYPRCPVRGIENERETCLFKTRKRLQVIGAGGWTATTEENSARSVRDSHQHTHHGRSSWTWDFQAPKTFHSQG